MSTLASILENSKPSNENTKLSNGYVLFEGQSPVNGENIVGILTIKTTNKKTGQMAQLWILNADIDPVDAKKQGKDESVCGACKLRQSLGGACYVNLGHAPKQVYKAYKRGIYKPVSRKGFAIFTGLSIRFGAYGDPAMLPVDILATLKSVAKNNTSYTHQWAEKNTDMVLKSLSMASVDNIEEQKIASDNGWRTFRVANIDSEVLENEIVCPNVTKGITCLECKLCGGASVKAKNIVIPVHGTFKKRF